MTTKIKSGVIADNAIVSAHISSGAISSGHLSSIDTDAVSEGSSNLYFTTTRARTSLSVTDSGGDGSLAYDNSTGAITYTGPSAAEVRAHLSAGTGVTYSSGEFSIGQSVATTASPTFADINITGDLNITGDVNSLSVTDLDVTDKTITLGAGQNEASSGGSGIVVDGSSASILWDESNDEWDFNKAINVTGRVSAESIEIGSGYGGTPNTESQLILNDSGNNYITIGSGATSEGGILFADSGDNDVGVISYNHSTDILNVTAPNGIQFNDKLHIVASDPVTNQTLIEFLNTSGYGIYARTNSIGARGNTLEFIASDYNNNSAQTHEVLTLRPEGNVGIGTTNPLAPLTISNNGAEGFEFGPGVTNFGVANTNYIASYDRSASTYRDISFDMGGTESNAIRFKTGGNVGIGTSNPGFALDISNTTSAKLNLQGGTNQNGIRFAAAGTGGVSSSLYYLGVGSGLMGTDYGAVLLDVTNNRSVLFDDQSTSRLGFYNNSMVINSSGNVGIGITTPLVKLDVRGSASAPATSGTAQTGSLRISQTVGDGVLDMGFYTSSNGTAWLQSTNKTNLATNYDIALQPNGGNVGIGTDSPDYALDVYDVGEAWIRADSSTSTESTANSGLRFAHAGVNHGVLYHRGSDDALLYFDNIAASTRFLLDSSGNLGIGTSSPSQALTVATTTNYDPPGLGNSNATFSVLKKDNVEGGNYGIITGISSDGNVWSQVQRVDGTATGYNYYLQPSGGSVGIGVPQNHTYIPNLIYPLRVAKQRSGTGNVTDYLSKISIDGMGYGGSNYQMAALDFSGGNTAGKSGVDYGRIGCSSMNGANNQHEGSLEFYVKAPGFSMSGTTHAMKITGQANTASAGGGTTRNGVLFTYQGLAIDRSWADYPSINVMNSTPYSSSVSTQGELRIHGNNVSSASYPGTSGSDFSCTVRADGGYVTGSDRRRKRNITTIDNALDTVKQLTGKRFQTINRSDEVQEHISKNGYKLGFIAQEVEDIIPEAVQYHADEDDGTENWNSSYAMDYGSVVALLVNAIKEQDTTIQDLKDRIQTLEG